MTSQAKLDEFAKKGLEAQKKYKKATTTNLLKWKIDWEQGARHARDMVKNFRCAGPEFRRDYIEALKCSAKAHEESNSIHTAGTEYEALAQALKEEKDWRGAAEANAQASRMFRGKSEWDKAALVLTRAAECVEEKEPSQALSYMDQACSIYEEQERYEFHEATFKKAIAMAVKMRRYDTAIDFIHRQNKIILHRMETFERDLYKNLLSIVVIRFAEREYEKAQAEFNTAQNMENFGRSEEWSAASDLFTAYSAGSNEELAEVLKRHSCFKYLSVPVAQLARKLQFNAEVVAQGKQRAKEFLEGPDEPDSDEYETDDGEESEPEEKKVPPRKKPVAQEDEDEDVEEMKPPPTKRITSATSTSTSTGAKKSTRDRDEPKSASSTRAALFAKNEPASASTRSALFAKSSDDAGSSARAALFADVPKKKKITSPKSTDDKQEDDDAPAPPNKKGGMKTTSNPFDDQEEDDVPTSSPKKGKKNKKSVTEELDELAKWAAEAAKEGEEEEETTTTTEKTKKKKKSVTDEADELDLTGATITDENENEEGQPKPKKLKKKKKKPVHDSTLDDVEVGEDGLVNLT